MLRTRGDTLYWAEIEWQIWESRVRAMLGLPEGGAVDDQGEARMIAEGVVQRLRGELGRRTFRVQSEAEMQAAVCQVVTAAEIEYVREYRLSAHDRIDIWLPSFGLAIELKMKGSLADLTRQVHRYTEDARVNGVLVVTTLNRLRAPDMVMNGKPVWYQVLRSGGF